MNKSVMLLAVATVGLGSMNAWAVDNRILPGMLCQKIDGTGTPLVGWAGSMNNVSASADLRVSCPIVRDNAGQPPFAIAVMFIDQNPGETGCCQFYSTDPSSDNVFWGNQKVCTTTPFTGGVAQSLQVPTSAGAFTLGTEFLFCSIPPTFSGLQSAVVSYVVQE